MDITLFLHTIAIICLIISQLALATTFFLTRP